MTLQITGHHIEITPALREFTEKKFSRLKPHHADITSLHVILQVNKHDQIAEAQINVPGQTIHAKASNNDLYTAIDALVSKLSRQLIKYKEKNNQFSREKIQDEIE